MTLLAVLSLAAWLYLAFFHGRFWHADQRLTKDNANSVNADDAPNVTAVIPARNEVETIAVTVRSLLGQDYPGDFRIVVVDDDSTDGTADAVARELKTDAERASVAVVAGAPLPEGWAGKMWAVKQGVEAAGAPKYLLLTDADITHAPDALSRLVGKAESEGLGLVSLMVRLNCTSHWEKLLIPAFVYFFQMLYPFPVVNDPARGMAAAAGGCMLVDREALSASGGIAAIRNALIDDCSLAARIKPLKPIWLGLEAGTHSTRVYDHLGPIWRMVARSAYVQLRFNPLLLLGTVLGMALLYLTPPVALVLGWVSGDTATALPGAAAWAVMAWTFVPTLALYRLNGLWALSLPVAGVLYALMTVDSARRHYLGRGGAWKGRTYAA